MNYRQLQKSGEEYEKAIYESEKREEIAEAREEGLEQGLEQGIKQGEKKTAFDFIKNMFSKGSTVEFISDCANMSIEEVKDILGIN